jgi:hypothetical protein
MTGTTTLTALPSKITGSISMLSTVINVNTSYIFNITIYDAITSSGKIKIILPPTITIMATSSTCANVNVTNMAVFPTCSFNFN